MSTFRRRPSPILLASVLSAGCCGGYAVVRTTVHERASLPPGGSLAVVGASGELANGGAAVLHYRRLGEPLNACSDGAKFIEELWIQVPSTDPAPPYTIGGSGVVAKYLREQGGNPVNATGISGTVRVKDRAADGVAVRLDVTIRLPSGQEVRLDDDYVFHPATPSQ
jgi:hypothetical protein